MKVVLNSKSDIEISIIALQIIKLDSSTSDDNNSTSRAIYGIKHFLN